MQLIKNSPEAKAYIQGIYSKLEAVSEAQEQVKVLDEAISTLSKNIIISDQRHIKADLSFKLGFLSLLKPCLDIGRARNCFRIAVLDERDPEQCARAWANLGFTYVQRNQSGDLKKAIYCYEQVLKRSKDDSYIQTWKMDLQKLKELDTQEASAQPSEIMKEKRVEKRKTVSNGSTATEPEKKAKNGAEATEDDQMETRISPDQEAAEVLASLQTVRTTQAQSSSSSLSLPSSLSTSINRETRTTQLYTEALPAILIKAPPLGFEVAPTFYNDISFPPVYMKKGLPFERQPAEIDHLVGQLIDAFIALENPTYESVGKLGDKFWPNLKWKHDRAGCARYTLYVMALMLEKVGDNVEYWDAKKQEFMQSKDFTSSMKKIGHLPQLKQHYIKANEHAKKFTDFFFSDEFQKHLLNKH